MTSKRLIHAFFGALLGGLIGLGWATTSTSSEELLIAVGLGALVFGLLAAFGLDRFWESRWWG